MMKSILVPVDFSKSAESALKYALSLADRLNAKVFLFHSFYSPHASGHLSASDADSGKKTGHEIAVQELTDLYNKCAPAVGQQVEYISSPHELREELPGVVKEKEIDLIIMGTQGIGWLEGMIFDTNTSWAIENINCPVIAIPENEVTLQIRHMTYASEYLNSDIVNLKSAVNLANLFGADITIVHIEPHPNTAADQKLHAFKAKLETEIPSFPFAYTSINAPMVGEALEDYIKRHPVDLLVMSAQQRDLFDLLFGKSITKLMVHHLSRPILFFHHKSN